MHASFTHLTNTNKTNTIISVQILTKAAVVTIKIYTYSCKLLLRHALGLASLLDQSWDVKTDSFMMEFFRLAVELCHVLGRWMLLVLPCWNWWHSTHYILHDWLASESVHKLLTVHHHHYPRISSRRKSWNKTSGLLCVTYYTTAVMSMLLWPIVCTAVWSAEHVGREMDNCLSSQINHLRKRLRPHGLDQTDSRPKG